MTELEALEAKTGRVYTIADWQRVGEKRTRPLTYTETDFLVLDHFDGPTRAAEAREAQRQAQLALVQPAAAATTKSTELLSTKEQMRMAAVTHGFLHDHVVPALKKIKDQQDARVRSLEQRLKEQDARILELEASAAARSKVDV